MRPGNGDFHIAAKLVQEPHQAVGGKAFQPTAGDGRDLGLVKAEDVRRLRLREAASLDDALDMDREDRFGQQGVGVPQAEIGKREASRPPCRPS